MQGRERAPEKRGAPHVPVVTVSSGKGGVGKSSLVANLGTLLARQGVRVLLVDGDLGLANLDILLGVQTGATLEQLLGGTASLQEAVIGVEPNLWLLPAAAGLFELRDADRPTREKVLALFEDFPWEMDLILVDVGAGIQPNVLSLHSPLFESVIVLSPEPTSLTDAYSLIKLLRRHAGVTRASAIVNQVTDGMEGQQTFKKLKEVAGRFIDVELEYLGHCARDEKFLQAVMKRKSLLDLNRGGPGMQCLELLAKRLLSLVSRKAQLEAGRRGGAQRAGITLGRFQEEPAHYAPRNTAHFFGKVLGEVKA